MALPREDATLGPKLKRHSVQCYNGCNKKVTVYTWPGEKPTKYKYCRDCKARETDYASEY